VLEYLSSQEIGADLREKRQRLIWEHFAPIVRRCQAGRYGGDVRVGSQLRRGSADLHVQLAGIERFSWMVSAPVRWLHYSPMTPRR